MQNLGPLYVFLFFLWIGSTALAQSDTLNRTDANGMKQGYWIIYGKDKPGKGYPPDGKFAEGRYVDNRREGLWIIYHPDGVTPRTKGMFHNNHGNGEYTKYYDDGTVREEGTYGNKKQTGTYRAYHPNGQLAQEKTFNEDGREEGKVAYYYDDGTPEFILEKKDGQATGTATRYYPNGDVKAVITYDANGEVLTTEEKEMVNPPKGESGSDGGGGPRGDQGVKKDGTPFAKNGYNKIYNDNDELWMDGEFKNGRLWDGKLYKYDKDGILLKIEVWKNGKYHSDGQLG